MDEIDGKSNCPGCGALLAGLDGPTHAYMTSSPACFAAFNELLAAEYSDPSLLGTHRMTVDTYAVQHPGDGKSRKAIQSVGLHLARLCIQLSFNPRLDQTNDVMLGMAKHKVSLVALDPPKEFTVTVADIVEYAGTARHSEMFRKWAEAAWQDWKEHHSYIRNWITGTGVDVLN